MPAINKVTVQVIERQALVGIDKYVIATTSVPVLGTSYTPAQLKAVLQADLDAAAATQTAYATWRTAVQTERTKHDAAHGVLLGLKAFVVAQYGKTAANVFADFGFTPPKVSTSDPTTKVAAAAKARATRKARGTLGKKQKLAITATPPSAAAPAASPAPATAVTPAQAPAATGIPTGTTPAK